VPRTTGSRHLLRVIQLALVSFESTSQGQLAMVIYEWGDYHYLGKVTSEIDDYLPVSIRAMPVLAKRALMSLVSRKRMYAPQTLCELTSASHPILATSSSTCQLASP
jgi:hypothetical protein